MNEYTQKFLENATKAHGDHYDYTGVFLNKHTDRIKILCRIHGPLKVSPYNHVKKGVGCRKCLPVYTLQDIEQQNLLNKDNNDKYKNQIFINKAIKIHGDKYDYSKVFYTKAVERLIITCKLHGDFIQTPECHLKGNGCSKCSKCHKYETTGFIIDANIVHNNKYDYSKTQYTKSKKKSNYYM